VPLTWAHALPSAPLRASARRELTEIVLDSIAGAGELHGLVVALHGACSAEDEPLADAALLADIRTLVGPTVPIAVTLDLHGNPTPELVEHVTVLTGYRTNPHVDMADTGIRAVRLLAEVLDGRLRPVVHLARRPAIFPDECLRIPDGPVAAIVARSIGDPSPAIVDISIFPTQPWLDAPGAGFTAVVIGDADVEADTGTALAAAERIATAVWDARTSITAEPATPPDEAIARVVAAVRSTGIRPGIVTEAADAPTAGAAGDGTGVLAALLRHTSDTGPSGTTPSAAVTVRDPQVVDESFELGLGGTYRGPIGARIDQRWTEPVRIEATVVHLGSGTYRLEGAGYGGTTVGMGRHAVLRTGDVVVLVTELAAWSADPATWRHAGIDPDTLDVLAVKSCTDYRANFPDAAPFALVADVPGPATSDLSSLTFRHCSPPPYPTQGWAASRAALRPSADG
jgi:microcystin degradation protein MlrC